MKWVTESSHSDRPVVSGSIIGCAAAGGDMRSVTRLLQKYRGGGRRHISSKNRDTGIVA